LGPQIQDAVSKKPDGLLLHENFIMSLFPLHLGTCESIGATLTRWRRGPVRCRTANGGRIFRLESVDRCPVAWCESIYCEQEYPLHVQATWFALFVKAIFVISSGCRPRRWSCGQYAS
jgi:hypothetical protein